MYYLNPAPLGIGNATETGASQARYLHIRKISIDPKFANCRILVRFFLPYLNSKNSSFQQIFFSINYPEPDYVFWELNRLNNDNRNSS